jgi:hypothetical protein
VPQGEIPAFAGVTAVVSSASERQGAFNPVDPTWRMEDSILANPCIDSGPAVESEPPHPPPPRFVQSPQRDHRYSEPPPDSRSPRRTQPGRPVMRARGINRRHEQSVRPGALPSKRLRPRMRRPRPDALRDQPTMDTVSTNRTAASHHHDQPTSPRQSQNPPQQCPPLPCRRCIMPKHYPRSRRQSSQRGP